MHLERAAAPGALPTSSCSRRTSMGHSIEWMRLAAHRQRSAACRTAKVPTVTAGPSFLPDGRHFLYVALSAQRSRATTVLSYMSAPSIPDETSRIEWEGARSAAVGSRAPDVRARRHSLRSTIRQFRCSHHGPAHTNHRSRGCDPPDVVSVRILGIDERCVGVPIDGGPAV